MICSTPTYLRATWALIVPRFACQFILHDSVLLSAQIFITISCRIFDISVKTLYKLNNNYIVSNNKVYPNKKKTLPITFVLKLTLIYTQSPKYNRVIWMVPCIYNIGLKGFSIWTVLLVYGVWCHKSLLLGAIWLHWVFYSCCSDATYTILNKR